jgi:hypothetical protein
MGRVTMSVGCLNKAQTRGCQLFLLLGSVHEHKNSQDLGQYRIRIPSPGECVCPKGSSLEYSELFQIGKIQSTSWLDAHAGSTINNASIIDSIISVQSNQSNMNSNPNFGYERAVAAAPAGPTTQAVMKEAVVANGGPQHAAVCRLSVYQLATLMQLYE